jgi:hypothetical protein
VQLERNININPSSSPTPLHSTCPSSSDRVAPLYALTLLRFHLLSFYYGQDHPLLQAGSLFASTFIPAERPSIRVSYIHTVGCNILIYSKMRLVSEISIILAVTGGALATNTYYSQPISGQKGTTTSVVAHTMAPSVTQKTGYTASMAPPSQASGPKTHTVSLKDSVPIGEKW